MRYPTHQVMRGGPFHKASRTSWRRSGKSGPATNAWKCGSRSEPGQKTVRGTVFPANARIGQKNKITRRWARRGAQPRAPHDQRTKWAYIFGSICSAEGKGAGLVMPWCDTEAMQTHLLEISATVAAEAHAILILDQAGWHLSGKLVVPANLTLLPLPPRSPEMNPVKTSGSSSATTRLSNRVFKGYDDIVAHGCDAWNELMDQPWRIRSIGRREWAHRF